MLQEQACWIELKEAHVCSVPKALGKVDLCEMLNLELLGERDLFFLFVD